MNCPHCGNVLPDELNTAVRFCPVCGKPLFEAGRQYKVLIQCSGQRLAEGDQILILLDEKYLYEVRPGDNICFAADSGFHTIKFRRGIRNKVISLIVTSGFIIKCYFNTLSGLIETSVNAVDENQDSPELRELQSVPVSEPLMVSDIGERGFDAVLGEDAPEIEVKVTSGFENGTLRLYTDRFEFSSDNKLKNDVIKYKDVLSVSRKMGSVDIQCAGNVHKVYSIPKDTYNEVIAFLTNKTAR